MTAPVPAPTPTSPWAPFVTLAEKVFWTYVQAVLALLIVGSKFDLSAVTIAGVAAIPAALTVVANGAPGIPQGLPWAVDTVLRAVRTYVVSFAGFLIALPVFGLNYSILAAASTAALPAALAVVKSAIAGHFGEVGTPAFLPPQFDVSASAPAQTALAA